MSNLLQTAIVGEYPDFTIDFSKVNVSANTGLENPTNSKAFSNSPGLLTFTWTDNSNLPNASRRDKAMVVVYCEETKQMDYNTAAGQRSDETAILKLKNFCGQTVHAWIAFISENQAEISSSTYLG